MEEFETVLRTPELGPGAVARVQAHGRDIALANVGQTYYAVTARCPVDGTDLASSGRLRGELLECPHDAAQFDVRTGEQVNGDSVLESHAVRVEGNLVRVGPPRD